MIDLSSINPVFAQFKVDLAKHFKAWRPLWDAVKVFQENWDVDAADFVAMYQASIMKAIKMFYCKNDHPLEMLLDFARKDSNAVRQMFRDLYDESQDLGVRMLGFQEASGKLRARFGSGIMRFHLQSFSVISTYLWLKYPEKYYIYYYDVYALVAKALQFDIPERDGSVDSFCQCYLVYDNLCEILRDDHEFGEALNDILTKNGYSDPSLHMTALVFGAFLSEAVKKEEAENQKYEWLYSDYNPGFSTDDWVGLLNDPLVFNFRSLQVVQRMMSFGVEATWGQLAGKYGENPKFYEDGVAAVTARIQAKTHCPLIAKENQVSKWPLIMCQVRVEQVYGRKTFLWRLRNELVMALCLIDLPVSLLEPTPAVWKIALGTKGMPDTLAQMQQPLLQQRIVAMDCGNSQPSNSFKDDVKAGDFFFLCVGETVQLLGRFTETVEEKQDVHGHRWLERHFEKVAMASNQEPYTGHPYWWAPTSRVDCRRVPEDQYDDLVRLVLYPYFGKLIQHLIEFAKGQSKKTLSAASQARGERGYWTVIAAQESCCCQLPVGAERSIRVLDKLGRPHRISGNFNKVKVGDPVMCVHSGVGVVALAKVVKACDGEEIRIAKVEQLPNPVTIADLDADPVLVHREGRHQLGTIFILTKDEYEAMLRLVQMRKDEYRRNVVQQTGDGGNGDVAGDHGNYDQAGGDLDQNSQGLGPALGTNSSAYGEHSHIHGGCNHNHGDRSQVHGDYGHIHAEYGHAHEEAPAQGNYRQVSGDYVREGASANEREADFAGDACECLNEGQEGEPYTKADFLAEVFMDEARFDDLAHLVKSRKNVILQGVPGVGKSYVARRLAYALLGQRDAARVRAVQFHRNFTYEKFVVGYRTQSDGSMARYAGAFVRFCQKAALDKQRDYFFIIDEINRGNAGDILGELVTALEPRRRGDRITLAGPQGRGMTFSVPNNVYVLGTMNAADQEAVLRDRVVRRRFAFFEMEPAFETESFEAYQRELGNASFDRLVRVMTELNRAIEADDVLGRNCRIGHSYLCLSSKEECTSDWMRAVLEHEIVPALEELWREDPTMARRWKERLERSVR